MNGPTAMIGGMSLEDPNHTHWYFYVL
jgi:hypothetical protein